MRKLIPAVFAFLAAGVAHALGFGDLVLNSALNQPLNASVELLAVRPSERNTVEVRLADPEIFERFGLSRSPALDDVRIEVLPVRDNESRLRVRLTTEQPVREPFLTFLLEADWAGGRALREYSVLLDPPVETPAARAPVASRRAPSPAPADTPPTPRAEPVPTRTEAPRRRIPTPAGVSGGRYGPIARNETLWSIARELRPGSGVSMNQMQLAIYRANPQAFSGNINRLLAGATLVIPEIEEIQAVDRNAARREIIEQQRDYERYRRNLRSGNRSQASATASSDGAQASPEGGTLRLEPPSDEDIASQDTATAVVTAEGETEEELSENPAATAQALAEAGRAASEGSTEDVAGDGDDTGPTAGGDDESGAEPAPGDSAPEETGSVRDVAGGGESPPEEATVVPEGSESPVSARNILLTLAVLLVAAVTFVWLRRRQYKPLPADFATATEARVEPTMPSEETAEPEETLEEREEAVAELLSDADGYIEQQLYDEALSALEVGLEEYPDEPALQRKMAEVRDAAAGADTRETPPEPLSDEVSPEDEEASVTADEDDWEEPSPDIGDESADEAATPADEAPQEEPREEDAASGEKESFKLDFDLDEAGIESADVEQDKARTDAGETTEQRPPSLDVDMSDYETGGKDEDAETAEPEKAAGDETEVEDDLGDFDLDSLSLDDEETEEGRVDKPDLEGGEGSSSPEEAAEAESDETPEATEEAPEETSGEGDAESDADVELDEVSTKLDLARAYLDMGEPDMARSLLDEVKDQGNAEQRREAEELLERAG